MPLFKEFNFSQLHLRHVWMLLLYVVIKRIVTSNFFTKSNVLNTTVISPGVIPSCVDAFLITCVMILEAPSILGFMYCLMIVMKLSMVYSVRRSIEVGKEETFT